MAFVGLNFQMSSFMVSLITLADKSLFTKSALVEIFLRVSSMVDAQITLFSDGYLASLNLARVQLFDQQMVLKNVCFKSVFASIAPHIRTKFAAKYHVICPDRIDIKGKETHFVLFIELSWSF